MTRGKSSIFVIGEEERSGFRAVVWYHPLSQLIVCGFPLFSPRDMGPWWQELVCWWAGRGEGSQAEATAREVEGHGDRTWPGAEGWPFPSHSFKRGSTGQPWRLFVFF